MCIYRSFSFRFQTTYNVLYMVVWYGMYSVTSFKVIKPKFKGHVHPKIHPNPLNESSRNTNNFPSKINIVFLILKKIVYSMNQEWSEVLSWKHFWSFTAKQCCRILLNKWSGRGFGVAENVIQVSGSLEIPNWFEKLVHPHQTPILLA